MSCARSTRRRGCRGWSAGRAGSWTSCCGCRSPTARWLNFVYDWDSDKNRAGHHVAAGQNFWLARAVVGVGHAATALGDERAQAAFVRGMTRAAAEAGTAGHPVAAPAAALRAADAGDHDVVPWIRTWADELVECRDGVVLKNSAYEVEPPHLWAHIQEGVLATAGAALQDSTLTSAAVASAEAVVLPAIEHAFAGARSMAYEVSSCTIVADRLYAATGERRWADAAADARAWFDGRNMAKAPTYDVERGRVADGIDEDRVSDNSGAESNISGAEALLDRADRDRTSDARPVPRMTAELVAVVLVTGFAAATQSITGFGYALIVVPGLTLLFGPKVAVVAMTSVGVPLVAWNAVRWRADIQRREAITVTAAALLGMPVGIAVLTRADDQVLTAIIGVDHPGPDGLAVAWPPAADRSRDGADGGFRIGRARRQRGHERTAARDRVPGHRDGARAVPGDPAGLLLRGGRDRAAAVLVAGFVRARRGADRAGRAAGRGMWRVAWRSIRRTRAPRPVPLGRARLACPLGCARPHHRRPRRLRVSRATCSASEVSPSRVTIENSSFQATGQVENFAITTLAGPWTKTVCPLIPEPM